MNDFEPLPLEPGETYVVPLSRDGHQTTSAPGSIFPAVVADVGEKGETQPRFRREVVEQIGQWLSASHDQSEDPLVILADNDGLYRLGAVMSFCVLPMPQSDNEAALLADHDRLVPRTDELMVGLFFDDDDPTFPALVGDDSWNGWACPGFRREVAEVVAAWINEMHRRHPDGSELAYWHGDDLVLIDAPCNGGGLAERVTPDQDGRYHIGGWRWTWSTVAVTQPAEPPQLDQ